MCSSFPACYASPSYDSTACALASRGLACPATVWVHIHGRRECDEFDQTLRKWNTLHASHDTFQVHLVALSGMQDSPCRLLHAVTYTATFLLHFCLALVSRLPSGPKKPSLGGLLEGFDSSESQHADQVSYLLQICRNRSPTKCCHEQLAQENVPSSASSGGSATTSGLTPASRNAVRTTIAIQM